MFYDNWFTPSKKKTEVLLLSARNGSLERVPIVNETDLHLESGKKKGITRHFDIEGRGWMEKGVGKMYFFAYTALIKTIRMQNGEPTTMGVGVCLEKILGAELYAKVHPDIKEKVENAEWGIIISPNNPTDEDLKGASNESRHTESDERMIDYYAKKIANALKSKFDLTTLLMGGFGGGFLVLLAVMMRWIKV